MDVRVVRAEDAGTHALYSRLHRNVHICWTQRGSQGDPLGTEPTLTAQLQQCSVGAVVAAATPAALDCPYLYPRSRPHVELSFAALRKCLPGDQPLELVSESFRRSVWLHQYRPREVQR